MPLTCCSESVKQPLLQQEALCDIQAVTLLRLLSGGIMSA